MLHVHCQATPWASHAAAVPTLHTCPPRPRRPRLPAPAPRSPRPQEAPAGERAGLSALLEPLQEVCKAHAGGKGGYAAALCTRLIDSFLEVRGRRLLLAALDKLLRLAVCYGPAGAIQPYLEIV